MNELTKRTNRSEYPLNKWQLPQKYCQPLPVSSNPISLSFLALIMLNEFNGSSRYSDPPFSNPPCPSFATFFPIWHLPCVTLDEYHQKYVFWRNKSKHCS